jgi:hypothetical protein
MKQQEISKEIQFPLATLIVTYLPREALKSLLKKMAFQVQKAWTGKAGSIPWTNRSQDLNLWDFYLRKYVNDEVYQPPIHSSLDSEFHRPQLTWMNHS